MSSHMLNSLLMMSGVLITAVFTLVTPAAAHTSLTLLYVVRIIEGLGEGVTFPAMLAMISRWSAPEERSRHHLYIVGGCHSLPCVPCHQVHRLLICRGLLRDCDLSAPLRIPLRDTGLGECVLCFRGSGCSLVHCLGHPCL